MKFDIKTQEKRILYALIGIVLLYSLLTILFDLKKIMNLAFSFNWKLLPLLIFLSFSNYLFRALRFHYLLKKININLPFKNSFQIFLSGVSMTLTPGKTGEVIKAYLVKKYTGNRFSEMIPLIIFERFTDGIAMILLGLAGFYFLNNFFLLLFLASILPAAFYFFIKQRKRIVKILHPFEKRFPKLKLLENAMLFFDNAEKLLTPKIFLTSILIALFAWLLEGLALFIIISFFASPSLKILSLSLFAFSFSSIAGFLALIPGGIGVAEGSITYLLETFSPLNLTQSIFSTLLFRSTTLIFGVILGSFVLFLTLSSLKKFK